MVEHVQVLLTPASARWCAAAATVYCVMVGLVAYSGEGADFRYFGWVLGGITALITLVPQLFRRRTAFVAASWASITLIAGGGLLFLIFGGCLLLPAVLMLVVGALQPGPPADGRVCG